MDSFLDFLKFENLRFLIQNSAVVLAILGLCFLLYAVIRLRKSAPKRLLAASGCCFALSVSFYFAYKWGWLPDLDETPKPNPARIAMTITTTDRASFGTTSKVSLTNTGRSKRSVTVTSLSVNISSVIDTPPDASLYSGHGPNAVNELVVVHANNGSRRVFFVGDDGQCQVNPRVTTNLLDSLKTPVNVTLAPGETYSLIVRTLAETLGVYNSVWRVEYVDFEGRSAMLESRSEMWSSIGGAIEDDKNCMGSAGFRITR